MACTVIDTELHRSYIVSSVAEKLGSEVVGEQIMIHLLFRGVKTKLRNQKACCVFIQSMDGSYKCHFVALQEKVICHNILNMNDSSWTEELKRNDISLSNAGNNNNNEIITLLIRADIASKLFTGRILQLNYGVIALEKRLG